jgi:hypothetical protein
MLAYSSDILVKPLISVEGKGKTPVISRIITKKLALEETPAHRLKINNLV